MNTSDNAINNINIINKKVCAIIAEYNPFHNGHAYHILQTKQVTGCDFVVAIMSGNFSQRGNATIVDKWTRTVHALNNGVDMVVLLPAIYATASAEFFAKGAISIIKNLGFVTDLSFGIENTEFDFLAWANGVDYKLIQLKTKQYIKTGVNSKTAYQLAIKEVYGDKIALAFNNPNFILGYEYIKALNSIKSKINITTIERTNDYNNMVLTPPHASATAIREAVLNNHLNNLAKCSNLSIDLEPQLNLLQSCLPYPFSSLPNPPNYQLYQAILALELKNRSIQELSSIVGTTEGIEYALKNISNKYSDYNKILHTIKSKRYLHSRLNRLILNCYLGNTKELFNNAHDNKEQLCYILGVKKASPLLSLLPKHAILNHKDTLSQSTLMKDILAIERRADNLYCCIANLDIDITKTKLIKV